MTTKVPSQASIALSHVLNFIPWFRESVTDKAKANQYRLRRDLRELENRVRELYPDDEMSEKNIGTMTVEVMVEFKKARFRDGDVQRKERISYLKDFLADETIWNSVPETATLRRRGLRTHAVPFNKEQTMAEFAAKIALHEQLEELRR